MRSPGSGTSALTSSEAVSRSRDVVGCERVLTSGHRRRSSRREVPLPRSICASFEAHLGSYVAPGEVALAFTGSKGAAPASGQVRRCCWQPAVAAARLDGLNFRERGTPSHPYVAMPGPKSLRYRARPFECELQFGPLRTSLPRPIRRPRGASRPPTSEGENTMNEDVNHFLTELARLLGRQRGGKQGDRLSDVPRRRCPDRRRLQPPRGSSGRPHLGHQG